MAAKALRGFAAVWVLALGRGIAADQVVLQGFEDPEDLPAAAASQARFELIDSDRKAGSRSLRLDYEAIPAGKQGHPAFVLQGRALPIGDFARFEALGFWVKNVGPSEAEISVAVLDEKGRRSFPRPATFTVEPGVWKRAFCRLVLHGLDPRRIRSVHLFQDSNREPRSFLIDELELLPPRSSRMEELGKEGLQSLEAARRSLSRIGAEALLGGDLDRLSKRLRDLASPDAEAAGTEERLAALSQAAREASNLAGSINISEKAGVLSLHGPRVSDAWLGTPEKVSPFRRIHLHSTSVTDSGLRALQGIKLEGFLADTRNVTGSGLASLQGAKLRDLDLGGSGVHDGTLVHVGRFPELKSLRLADTRVTSAGLEGLAGLSRLETLVLDGTAAEDGGLVHLRGLASLETLSLARTRVAGIGLAQLAGLKKLSTLVLEETPLRDAGLESLARLTSLVALDLSGTSITGSGLAGLERLENLAALDLTGTRVNDAALAGLGKLGGLKRLELSSTRITDAALAAIAGPSRLEYLDIYGTNVTDAGIRGLAGQRALKDLYIGGTAAGAAALDSFAGMRELTNLDLQGTRVGDAALAPLAKIGGLASLVLRDTALSGSGLVHLGGLRELRGLDLSGTNVDDAALEHLAALPKLAVLDLSGTRVTDGGLERLVTLEKLRELRLARTGVTDAGMVHVRKLKGLRALDLDETAVGDAGLAVLEELKGLDELGLSRSGVSDSGLESLGERIRSLRLSGAAVTDAGVARIRRKDRLEQLDLAGTAITDRALESLARLHALRRLDLSATRVTDDGLEALAGFQALEELRLDRTPVTDAGAESLARAPRLALVSLEGARVTAQGRRRLERLRPDLKTGLVQPWVPGAGLSFYGMRPWGPSERPLGGAGRGKPGSGQPNLAGLRRLGSARSIRIHERDFHHGLLPLLEDLPGLERLDLRGTLLDDEGLAGLIGLQRLASLDLSRTRITDAGLARLKDMERLQELDLEGTAVRGGGLRHLDGLNRLRSLDLKDTPLSDEGVAALPLLPSLRKLELTNTRITGLGLESLERLGGIYYLDLHGTRIGTRGLDALGRMTGLTHLYLGGTGLTDAGLTRLSKLQGLLELGLGGTRITDAGCAVLAGFPRLERVRLGGTSITDSGLERLAAGPALRSIELEGTRVTEAGVRSFEKRRPGTSIVFPRESDRPEAPRPPAGGIAAAALYVLILLAICVYGSHRARLAWLLARDPGARAPREPPACFAELPRVTVQLPMFNERRVLERIIGAACSMDYPGDRVQVQVLDDSTDGSQDLARDSCERHRAAGHDIEYLHRGSRAGFKGGALEAGLASATGDLIAVFDADFVPPRDFLRRTVHHFTEPAVGMVQTEWSHLNRGESLLTECQAMLLDAHFVVEQTLRSRRGLWFNFNGTAGVWRRRAIEEAGGWHHDTLTEDTDLSYRAQLAGWRFVYLPGVRSSAELPSRMSAFLGQQKRWTKGLIQNAVKLLPRILRSDASFAVKAEAWFHLTSPILYAAMFLLTALALPAMLLAVPLSDLRALPSLGIGMAVLLLGTFAAAAFLLAAQRAQGLSLLRAAAHLPAVMALGIGMSASNARAALEALMGMRGPFVRTPKFDGRTEFDPDPSSRPRGRPAGLLELTAAGVLLACLVLSFSRPFTVIGAPFLLLFACGHFWVGAASLRDASLARRMASGRPDGAATRTLRWRAAAVSSAVAGGAAALVLAGVLVFGGRSDAEEPALTVGVDLVLADWRSAGEAVRDVASRGSGIELHLALDAERHEGEVHIDLDGPLSTLGETLARGRELRFDVSRPRPFTGELQAFAADAAGKRQYGSALFVEKHDPVREVSILLAPGRLTPPMGYTDAGFDPASGIRRIGLKVSAQSDRVRRAGYRPFRGTITITGVEIAPRSPDPEPEVRAVPAERAVLPVPVSPEEFLAGSGVDRPWPFGYGFSGPLTQERREELDRTYEEIARRGLRLTRLYAGDFRTGLVLDEDGEVSGIEAPFLDYLDAAAESANLRGITVLLCLLDNTIADGKGVEHPGLIADPVRSASFARKVLVPIAARLARRSVILDLFNEPENVTGIPLRRVQEHVDRCIAIIRSAVPEARLTVVSRSPEDLIYWRGRGLDLLAHNIFDARALAAASRVARPEADAPLLVAEMDPALASKEALDGLRRAGYRGVGLWGWGTEDRYAWEAKDLERIAAPLLVPAPGGGR